MNFLEQYLQSDCKFTEISKQELHKIFGRKLPKEKFYWLTGHVDCYGTISKAKHFCDEKEMQDIKKKGYYMA